MQKREKPFPCREPNPSRSAYSPSVYILSYPGSYWIITSVRKLFRQPSLLRQLYCWIISQRRTKHGLFITTLWAGAFAEPSTSPPFLSPERYHKTTPSSLYPNFWFMFYLFCCLKFWSMRVKRKVSVREGKGVDRSWLLTCITEVLGLNLDRFTYWGLSPL
jgi:hypothetical protein